MAAARGQGRPAPDERPLAEEGAEDVVGAPEAQEQHPPSAGDEPWDEAWLPQWVSVPDEPAEPERDPEPAPVADEVTEQPGDHTPDAEAGPQEEPEQEVAAPARRPLPPRIDAALADFRDAQLAAERAAEEQAAAQMAAWEEAIRAGEELAQRAPSGVSEAPAVGVRPTSRPSSRSRSRPTVPVVRTPPAGRRRARWLLPLAVLALAAVIAGLTLPGTSDADRPAVAAAEPRLAHLLARCPARLPRAAADHGPRTDDRHRHRRRP